MLSTLGWLLTCWCVWERGKVSERDILPLPFAEPAEQSITILMNSGAVNRRSSLVPRPMSPGVRLGIFPDSSSPLANSSLLCLPIGPRLPLFCCSLLLDGAVSLASSFCDLTFSSSALTGWLLPLKRGFGTETVLSASFVRPRVFPWHSILSIRHLSSWSEALFNLLADRRMSHTSPW